MKLDWSKYLYKQVNQPLFQIIDQHNHITQPELLATFSDDMLLKAYKLMHLARTNEEMSLVYAKNRQLVNTAPAIGQEAIQVATGLTIRSNIDWVLRTFRESPLWIALNQPLFKNFQFWAGYEIGNDTPKSAKIVPLNILVATQISQAVGIALANKIQNNEGIVYAMIGDGGTSEGEFSAAVNMAAVMNLKIIFIIQNNHWSISTTLEEQTHCSNLAEKGIGFGIEALKVDGNDFLASYYALQYVKEYVQKHQKPFLIEAMTYRMGPHSADDDPKKYRNEKKHEELCKSDPLIRFKHLLSEKKLWDEQQELNLLKTHKDLITKKFAKAMSTPPPVLKDIYFDTYAKMPEKLQKQYQEWVLRFEKAANND